MDEGGVAYFGKLVGEKLCACHARAVSQVELDFVPVAVDDLVELIQGMMTWVRTAGFVPLAWLKKMSLAA